MGPRSVGGGRAYSPAAAVPAAARAAPAIVRGSVAFELRPRDPGASIADSRFERARLAAAGGDRRRRAAPSPSARARASRAGRRRAPVARIARRRARRRAATRRCEPAQRRSPARARGDAERCDARRPRAVAARAGVARTARGRAAARRRAHRRRLERSASDLPSRRPSASTGQRRSPDGAAPCRRRCRGREPARRRCTCTALDGDRARLAARPSAGAATATRLARDLGATPRSTALLHRPPHLANGRVDGRSARGARRRRGRVDGRRDRARRPLDGRRWSPAAPAISAAPSGARLGAARVRHVVSLRLAAHGRAARAGRALASAGARRRRARDAAARRLPAPAQRAASADLRQGSLRRRRLARTAIPDALRADGVRGGAAAPAAPDALLRSRAHVTARPLAPIASAIARCVRSRSALRRERSAQAAARDLGDRDALGGASASTRATSRCVDQRRGS